MKLIIDNVNIKSDLHIYNLNNISFKVLPYDELLVETNTIKINTYSFTDGVYKILLAKKKSGRSKLIYNFYDNNKLVYQSKCITCCIKIEKGKISKYNIGLFIKNHRVYTNRYNLFIIKHWNLYWHYLHWLTYNYPKDPSNEDKNEIIKLINVMKDDGIKCSKCKMHFNEWINEYNINLSTNNKVNLFSYFFNLHNNINKRKNKKILNLNEAIDIYKTKDWESKLNKYGVSITQLFKERKIETFPELFYSVIEKNLRKEHNLD